MHKVHKTFIDRLTHNFNQLDRVNYDFSIKNAKQLNKAILRKPISN